MKTVQFKLMGISTRITNTVIVLLIAATMLALVACGEKKPAVDATKENASAETTAKDKEALDTAIEACGQPLDGSKASYTLTFAKDSSRRSTRSGR